MTSSDEPNMARESDSRNRYRSCISNATNDTTKSRKASAFRSYRTMLAITPKVVAIENADVTHSGVASIAAYCSGE